MTVNVFFNLLVLIDVTFPTFHELMFELNAAAELLFFPTQDSESEQNKESIFVTSLVSQFEMWPYTLVALASSANHARTASWMLALVNCVTNLRR